MRYTEKDSQEARKRRAEQRRKSDAASKKVVNRNWIIGIVALLACLGFKYFSN